MPVIPSPDAGAVGISKWSPDPGADGTNDVDVLAERTEWLRLRERPPIGVGSCRFSET
jgi:hypothetical protein